MATAPLTFKPTIALNPIQWMATDDGWLDPALAPERGDLLARVKAAGFDSVMTEIPAGWSPEQYRDLVEGAGLTLAPGYYGCRTDSRGVAEAQVLEGAEHAARQHQALGLSDIGVATGMGKDGVRLRHPAQGHEPDDERVDALTTVLGRVADVMLQHGVRPALHPHVATWIETEHEARAVLDALPAERLGFLPDTGHLSWAGADVAGLIADYAERIPFVHVKDCRVSVAQQGRERDWDYQTTVLAGLWVEPGRGELPMTDLLGHLPADFSGWLMVEVDRPDISDPDASRAPRRSGCTRRTAPAPLRDRAGPHTLARAPIAPSLVPSHPNQPASQPTNQPPIITVSARSNEPSEAAMTPTISIRRRRLGATIAAAGLCLSASIAGVATQTGSAGATTPTAGGTLSVAQPVDATPGSFLSPAFGNILSQYSVFETLTRISTETGEPEPVIAKSWETADDGLSMKIQLRDDVTFHSGKPLTSADVVFTLQQSQDPVVSAQGEQLTQYITAIEAANDYEVDLTFSRPMPNIFDLFEILPIVNEDSFADIASGEVVDGTGPFVWASWTPGSNISLEKYADYRDADNIWLDAIDINIIGDATAQTAAIRSGRVQYLYGLSALDTRTLSEQPGYELLETGGSALPLCFDVTQPPFDNQQVRQAINYGIDRERVLEQVQGGLGAATALPWKEATAGYDTTQGERYAYDPDRAQQMLDEAGFTGGSFDMIELNSPEGTAVGQIVQNNLEDLGFDVSVEPLTDADYNERVANGDMGSPMFMMSNGNAFSPATQVQIRPELRAEDNLENFTTPEYTDLIDAMTTAVSPDDQTAALAAYNDYFVDQAFCLAVVTRPSTSIKTDGVDGITGTSYGFVDLSHAYLV